ncbi:MAG: extracellular solute-binding protein [Propionicimonas sp.]
MKFSRKLATLGLAGALTLTIAACGGGQPGEPSTQPSGGGESTQPGPAVTEMTMLIGSSGDAETNAVQAAVDAWGKTAGVTVKVIAAADLNQELAQGFAGDAAPDLFYMSWDQFQTYASDQYLEVYAKDLPNADAFYPALRDMFSYDGSFVCAPKDFSTLGLVINTDLWKAAGLTDADLPTTWDQLKAVAGKLTSGKTVGLAMGAEYARVGVFMAQAGGGLMKDGAVTAASDQNVAALEYLQGLLKDGSLKWPADLGAGWAGEAFGKQTAAMVIEGPWIAGALKNDFPDVNYQVIELPAGPAGKGTFTFSNCWGIPEGQDSAAQAKELVTFLTSDEQQLKFADAFAVIPSTQTAGDAYAEKFPENQAFVAGVAYASTPLSIKGASDVVGELNNAITQLGSSDARAILEKTQGQLESLVG